MWVAEGGSRVPTSGLIATLMMLHACNYVTLYGTDFLAGRDPYHYWSAPGHPYQYQWPETSHWFALEHALYAWWAERGLLRLAA